jgi:hypothetical protein
MQHRAASRVHRFTQAEYQGDELGCYPGMLVVLGSSRSFQDLLGSTRGARKSPGADDTSSPGTSTPRILVKFSHFDLKLQFSNCCISIDFHPITVFLGLF